MNAKSLDGRMGARREKAAIIVPQGLDIKFHGADGARMGRVG